MFIGCGGLGNGVIWLGEATCGIGKGNGFLVPEPSEGAGVCACAAGVGAGGAGGAGGAAGAGRADGGDAGVAAAWKGGGTACLEGAGAGGGTGAGVVGADCQSVSSGSLESWEALAAGGGGGGGAFFVIGVESISV